MTASGWVEIEDFYPDEYSEIYLAGDGGEIWRAAVRDLDLSGPIVVRASGAGMHPPVESSETSVVAGTHDG